MKVHVSSRLGFASVALVLTIAACASPKETGITMERTVTGDYQTVAKCVYKAMMRQANAGYIPQLVDFDEEHAAELWSINIPGLGASSKLEEQRIEQHGDQVKMITYLPSSTLGQNQMRKQVGGYWDRCTT